jgi:hypothetical protein
MQIAQPVTQVIEALLQSGVELFAEGEVALGERSIDRRPAFWRTVSGISHPSFLRLDQSGGLGTLRKDRQRAAIPLTEARLAFRPPAGQAPSRA